MVGGTQPAGLLQAYAIALPKLPVQLINYSNDHIAWTFYIGETLDQWQTDWRKTMQYEQNRKEKATETHPS